MGGVWAWAIVKEPVAEHWAGRRAGHWGTFCRFLNSTQPSTSNNNKPILDILSIKSNFKMSIINGSKFNHRVLILSLIKLSKLSI